MAQSALLYGNFAPALFVPHMRSIGGIVAEVTIDEQSEDDLQITEHPVEQGAPIADHAFKRPATVTIRAGWSVAHSWDLSAETGVYGLLLSWQASLMPFDVITGKRSYSNMLIERLSVVTDQHSEWALMANITCRQVIIVSTSTTTVTDASSENPDDHADPSATAPAKEGGDKAPKSEGGLDPNARSTTLDRPAGGDFPGAVPDPTIDPTVETPRADLTPAGAGANKEITANGGPPPNNPPIDNRVDPFGFSDIR